MTYAIHYYDHDQGRVVSKQFISFSISQVIKEAKEEIGVQEADICAVILLDS